MKKKKLSKKTFDKIIEQAYFDYLFCRGEHAAYYAAGGKFHPINALNRNPEQVSENLWCRLINKHLNKHYYN